MDTQEVSFQETLYRVGRSKFVGEYHSDDYGHSNLKHEEREKVLAFILEIQDTRIRLLSMPGKHWAFEEMLLHERPDSSLLGLEYSYTVFAQARRSMPKGPNNKRTRTTDLQDRTMNYGTGSYTYSRRAANRKEGNRSLVRQSRSNRILFMSAETYATMLFTDYGATMEQKREFYEKFCKRNAAWLDFTCQLCRSVEETISHLDICMSNMECPVVITFMNARDKYHSPEERIARLVEIQPSLDVKKWWTYKGKGNISMLTVCAIMNRRV